MGPGKVMEAGNGIGMVQKEEGGADPQNPQNDSDLAEADPGEKQHRKHHDHDKEV